MSGGLWSSGQLLRPQASLPSGEQADAIAPADTGSADTGSANAEPADTGPADTEPANTEPAADQRLIPALSSWARAFPGVPRQVRAARHFVAALLDGSPRRDDAVIVISELFTNALQHTYSGRPGGLVVVQVSRWRRGVRIAVTDQGSAQRPVIRNARAHRDDAASVSVSTPRTASALADGVLPEDALTDGAVTNGALAGRLLTDRLLAGGMFADDVLADGADSLPADCGRGLYMVSCLAEHLDWHDDVRGRTVHAVLGRLPAGSPRGAGQLGRAAGEPPDGARQLDGRRPAAAHQVDIASRSA